MFTYCWIQTGVLIFLKVITCKLNLNYYRCPHVYLLDTSNKSKSHSHLVNFILHYCLIFTFRVTTRFFRYLGTPVEVLDHTCQAISTGKTLIETLSHNNLFGFDWFLHRWQYRGSFDDLEDITVSPDQLVWSETSDALASGWLEKEMC